MRIPILVTLDQNYLPQLRVLLMSLHVNHPGQGFDLYLLHSRIPDDELLQLKRDLNGIDFSLHPIKADKGVFSGAKITDRYPKEMYYRLLAAQFLPEKLEKILYLDPDILVINQIYELWEMTLGDDLFAAASHTGKTELANSINHIRLGTDTNYYNSGVLLINLKLAREQIRPETVFQFVEEHARELLLPDQDVLNAMFSKKILEIDDARWNYDARNYSSYLRRSGGEYNQEWVMENTSILHFCGRDKPWKSSYRRRFGLLYRHYMSLAERYLDRGLFS